jgi:DNA-binding NarL/FixJ family response regulator
MDYQLPKMNGAETTRSMLACKPNINILALSNYDESVYIKNILRAGAKGYVLKNIDADELVKAITTILRGKNYYSNDVAVKLIDVNDNVSGNKGYIKILSGEKLSEREIAVLRFINEGYTSKQIADKLFLGKRTVDKYRQRLLEKMNVSNTAGLLKQARILKLID